MCDITDIKNYILFLKRECGLLVTLHPLKKEQLILSSELMTFNIHENPYCIYIKSFPNAHRHCIERQKRIVEKCREGSFCGTCFAGVKEYVYPITNGKEILGFISVSGYRGDNVESYINATAKKYVILQDSLSKAALNLKRDMPSKERIDTLIVPLSNMLELAYIRSEGNAKNEESLIDSVIRYIKQHHTQSITLEDVCGHFVFSRSHISHMFKTHTGRSFREYLTDIRVEDAKSLLRYSRLSMTEIAFSVGFRDYTYFSNVFKKCVGVSPSAYRKSMK